MEASPPGTKQDGQSETEPGSEQESQPQRPRWRGVADFLKDYWAPMLAAVGVLLFAIRYGSYLLFYESFGVSPGEVGLGYSETLVQAIVATTLWAAIGGLLYAAVGYIGYRAMLRPLAVVTGRVKNHLSLSRAKLRQARWFLFGLYAGVAVVLFQGYLLWGGYYFGDRAEEGHPLAENKWFPETFTDWHAERVTVRLAADAAPGIDLSSEDCVLYLGKADGTAVLWNYTDKQTVRIPVQSVVLERGKKQAACKGGA